ncbi:HD-GYP hydrolase domain containing protein [Clostridium pasteurianum DSM 525 = ATCC 6013]|uniref:HD-GYP hydrolase domain containing protein n=1 Tax=Clostridium pasteurianum DSM 525 = ATCC 6013 TaxID=1262449 RepID=A0A0H3J2R5_CLOPA|nr:HD-GYP domain-containing protein [Clostridium pasteurianum]AJA46203.1 HD-GYP hydrolase domain containing protein [Clostridium pasteurianum DSM 525 = ATCC 6013]AJA50191.1 HD-GYP hydrolase domain containing protein [Clostridium pasteurianum DSM 525 = ATCC 6013]AOZ73659.1 HD family phosphohydrolase [Clostridium pasteurianum DSM 525 = ATCC 6013]AOZ77456.1 HD family phosphohydrolase [Clostridium pasteurianum]ELP57462.1 HD-GYP hydrolase domain containing protein [Clostridium pasteurianum DSM 525 
MRLIPIQCVKENTRLAKSIYDNDGKVLLKKGSTLTGKIIKKIKELNIYSIYIFDEYSNKIIEEIIKPEIRQKAIMAIKKSFMNINPCDTHKKINYVDKENEFNSILYIAKELIEEVLSKKDVMINLVDIKSKNNYIFQHSVNVAIISLIIGIKLNLHKFDLMDLCIGALLHDIGMIFVPVEILNKESELTKQEYDIVKQHTKKGYDFLRECFDISVTSIMVVLQHHEKIGGQGYPEGKSGDEISKFGKIVAIADTYDALTAHRPYRKAMSPNEALEYLMASGGIQFDYKYVQVFSQIVVPYPEGTLVNLTNGEKAIIEKISHNFPLRPKVKIIYSNDKKRINKIIELEKQLNIVIKDISYEKI